MLLLVHTYTFCSNCVLLHKHSLNNTLLVLRTVMDKQTHHTRHRDSHSVILLQRINQGLRGEEGIRCRWYERQHIWHICGCRWNERLKVKTDGCTSDFCKRVFFGDLLLHLLCELLFSFCTRTVTCGTKTEKVGLYRTWPSCYKNWTIIRTVNVKVNPWRRHVYRNLMYVRVSPKLGCVGGTGIHWVTRGTGTPMFI